MPSIGPLTASTQQRWVILAALVEKKGSRLSLKKNITEERWKSLKVYAQAPGDKGTRKKEGRQKGRESLGFSTVREELS